MLTLRRSPAQSRPAAPVSARLGTLVAERRQTSDRRGLPHPPWARQHAGREPNSPYSRVLQPQPHGSATQNTGDIARNALGACLSRGAVKAARPVLEGALAQQCAGATRQLPDPPASWGAGKQAHLLVGALAHSSKWRGVLADAEDFPHLVEALDAVVRRLGGVTQVWRFDRMATVCHPPPVESRLRSRRSRSTTGSDR